jgi:hypothetical protein
MKRLLTLEKINGQWILSWEEDGNIKQFTSASLDDIKNTCAQNNFSLDFTGAV